MKVGDTSKVNISSDDLFPRMSIAEITMRLYRVMAASGMSDRAAELTFRLESFEKSNPPFIYLFRTRFWIQRGFVAVRIVHTMTGNGDSSFEFNEETAVFEEVFANLFSEEAPTPA